MGLDVCRHNRSIQQVNKKQQPGGTVIHKNARITWMTMIEPATGWFEIFEIPTFDLDEVALRNDEYIEKSSDMVR